MIYNVSLDTMTSVHAFCVARDDSASDSDLTYTRVITSTFATTLFSPFTCPLTGVYEFTVHVQALVGAEGRVSLGTNLISSEARAQNEESAGGGSTSIISTCVEGGAASVTPFSGSLFYGSEFNTFCGELLYFDSSSLVFRPKHILDVSQNALSLFLK